VIYEMRKVGLHGSIIRLDHAQLAMPAGRDDDGRVFCQELLGIPEVAKPPHPRGDENDKDFFCTACLRLADSVEKRGS